VLIVGRNAPAIDPGTAQGTLTLDDESTPLTHAQTFRFRDLAGLGEHAGRSAELRVLLSAREVPGELLTEVDLKRLERFTQREGIPSVLVTVAPDADGVVSGSVMAMPAAPGIPLYTIHTAPDLEIATRDHRVSGKIVFEGARADFKVSATFSTPDLFETPPDENLVADGARSSAPAQAYLDFEQLLKRGEFTAARVLVTASMLPQIIDLEQRAGDPEFVRQFTARLPETDARREQIVQSVRHTDRAYLVIRQRHTSLTTLQRIDGRWKVDD